MVGFLVLEKGRFVENLQAISAYYGSTRAAWLSILQ